MLQENIERARKKWNEKTQAPPVLKRSRWWNSTRLRKHVGKRICGKESESNGEQLGRLLSGRGREPFFEKAISIACGAGRKEMDLVAHGMVGRFDLYEISDERISLGVSWLQARA
jgi:hypothetical protein